MKWNKAIGAQLSTSNGFGMESKKAHHARRRLSADSLLLTSPDDLITRWPDPLMIRS